MAKIYFGINAGAKVAGINAKEIKLISDAKIASEKRIAREMILLEEAEAKLQRLKADFQSKFHNEITKLKADHALEMEHLENELKIITDTSAAKILNAENKLKGSLDLIELDAQKKASEIENSINNKTEALNRAYLSKESELKLSYAKAEQELLASFNAKKLELGTEILNAKASNTQEIAFLEVDKNNAIAAAKAEVAAAEAEAKRISDVANAKAEEATLRMKALENEKNAIIVAKNNEIERLDAILKATLDKIHQVDPKVVVANPSTTNVVA